VKFQEFQDIWEPCETVSAQKTSAQPAVSRSRACNFAVISAQIQRRTSQRSSLAQQWSVGGGRTSPTRTRSQSWHRLLSYCGSYRYTADKDAHGRTGSRTVENTYRLEPSADERFYTCYAEPIIAQVLQVRIRTRSQAVTRIADSTPSQHLWVTWRRWSRDHLIAHMAFPIGPLEPNLYR